MGPAEFDLEVEVELADEITKEFGIDMDTFGDACAVAMERIDQDILNGKIGLL